MRRRRETTTRNGCGESRRRILSFWDRSGRVYIPFVLTGAAMKNEGCFERGGQRGRRKLACRAVVKGGEPISPFGHQNRTRRAYERWQMLRLGARTASWWSRFVSHSNGQQALWSVAVAMCTPVYHRRPRGRKKVVLNGGMLVERQSPATAYSHSRPTHHHRLRRRAASGEQAPPSSSSTQTPAGHSQC